MCHKGYREGEIQIKESIFQIIFYEHSSEIPPHYEGVSLFSKGIIVDKMQEKGLFVGIKFVRLPSVN